MTRTTLLFVLTASLCLISASSAFAAASYVFEPTLSLTGNCAESKLDPVPDPGLCPIPPGVPGKDHPSARLEAASVTVDSFGDIYVVSMLEAKGRIDVFASDGTFITEFADPAGPQSIAVDSKGNVYVFDQSVEGERKVRRFPPTAYEPDKGLIEYKEPPVVVVEEKTFTTLSPETSIAVGPNDLLYVDHVIGVSIFKSAEEGNGLLEKEVISGLNRSTGIAIDAKHKKIYLIEKEVHLVEGKPVGKSVIRIFELGAPHKEVGKITGSTTPKGEFVNREGFLTVDVDEEVGHVFVGDIFSANKVYEFEENGTYLATIEHSFEAAFGPGGVLGEMAVDNGPKSSHLQKEGWLFVPSVPSGAAGHVYAFEPNEEGPPVVESTSAGDITETEATLHGTINPGGLETTYRFEYVSQQQFEAEEGKSFLEGNATVVSEGTLSKGGEGVLVSAAATGLEPGTKYRFRIFARNENAKEEEGKDEGQGTFKTFPPEEPPQVCENEVFRIGLSAPLPDCRVYELVTPPDTNGRPPVGGFFGYSFSPTRASADGSRASFLVEGGSLPGLESAGSFNGDPYLATRTGEGWSTQSTGSSGKEGVNPTQRGLSPDQIYSTWQGLDGTMHIRYPDGHSELVGRGSLGEDPNVDADLITEGATHIVFATKGGSAIPLEENAPPAKTAAVYDRSATGPTHVVSLLPGNVTPAAKQDASYLAASEDGEGIAFSIGGTIYVRLHNTETLEVAGPGSTFAGISEEGKRVFYLEGGNLFAYDTQTKAAIPFSSSGDITPVNVATGGSRAYFVSPGVLTGEEENPNGEKAQEGKGAAENLYLSEGGGQISFVARVTKRDIEGELTGNGQIGGLGLWLKALNLPAIDPSRATPSGSTFLFESRANLTEFDSEGFAQVYRYNATENRLDCLSCSSTGIPPTSDASLQSVQTEQFSPEPAGSQLKISNQSPDGKRAFFQTAQPLVVRDTDEQLDVYEWEEEGVGGCKAKGGCVYSISGGHSASPDYLFAMSSSGDDVFFRTSDTLLTRDSESTLSLYDARVGGGFPEPHKGIPCTATDTCQPALTPPPNLSQPTTTAGEDGNFSRHRCPKGKHAVGKDGKTICVRKHRKHSKHRHRRTGSGQKGGAK